MKYRSLVSCVFLCSLISPAVYSATVNGTLSVTAVVGSGCSVNSSSVTGGVVNFGALNFGSITAINASNVDAQTTGGGSGSIVMNCSSGTPFSIAFDNGLHFSGGSRAMVNASDPAVLLSYTLYQNAARTVPWTSSSPLSTTASGGTETFNVYGRIPGGQSGVTSGNYSDTIQVVVSW